MNEVSPPAGLGRPESINVCWSARFAWLRWWARSSQLARPGEQPVRAHRPAAILAARARRRRLAGHFRPRARRRRSFRDERRTMAPDRPTWPACNAIKAGRNVACRAHCGSLMMIMPPPPPLAGVGGGRKLRACLRATCALTAPRSVAVGRRLRAPAGAPDSARVVAGSK